MKKNLLKVISLAAAAASLLSFAACGGKKEPATTERRPGYSESGVSEPFNETRHSETDLLSDISEDFSEMFSEPHSLSEPSSHTGGTGGVRAGAKPETTAELIESYNRALKNSNLKRRSLKQTLTKCEVGVPGGYDLMSEKKADVRKKIDVNDTAVATADLKELKIAEVKSAKRVGDTVTYHLNTAHADINDIANGRGGYLGVVDKKRSEHIAQVVAADVGVGGKPQISEAKYTFSEGVLTVKFNSDFTKIVKITFEGAETMHGTVKYSALNIKTDVACKLSSEYSA